MSTILVSSLPDYARSPERPDHGAPRQIEIVTTRAQRSARPRLAYALIAVGGIFLIFMAQLGVSIALSDGAYKISSLNSAQRDLTREASALNEVNNLNASPQNLRTLAAGIGMGSGGAAAFINSGSGKVTGIAAPAEKSGAGSSSNVPNGALPTAKQKAKEAAATATPPAVAATTNSPETENPTITVEGSTPTAAGAPAASTSTTSIPSSSGALPSPVTH